MARLARENVVNLNTAVVVGVVVAVGVSVGVWVVAVVGVKGRRRMTIELKPEAIEGKARMTDEELVSSARVMPIRFSSDARVIDALCDAVERLTRERDEARAGNYSANEHEPTWAELADYWKHCAEAAERKVEKLREALSFVGNISHSEGDTAGICDIVTAALADTEKMKD